MSNPFLTDVKGFTPVIDALVSELGLAPAIAYGVAWRFCNMKDGVCRASLATISRLTGLSRSTAQRALARLAAAGYLKDLTPGLRNKPHIYKDVGRARIMGLVAARVVTDSSATGDTSDADE